MWQNGREQQPSHTVPTSAHARFPDTARTVWQPWRQQPAVSQLISQQQQAHGSRTNDRGLTRNGSHEERKARWKEKRKQANPDHVLRGTSMPRAVQQKFNRMRAETCCRRCHMDQDEHKQMRGVSLNKHHIIAVRDGGHPTDPENLATLCYFCHQEWHEFWETDFGTVEGEGEEEGEKDHDAEEEVVQPPTEIADTAAIAELKRRWALYMAASPYCQDVMNVCPLPDEQASLGAAGMDACARCAMPAERCAELRPQRKTPLHPFLRDRHGESDNAARVCYFCQREWAIFWRVLRPDARLFFCTAPYRPIATPRGQPVWR